MWSLHAEQTCEIEDADSLATRGLAYVTDGQGDPCGTADDNFKLYASSNRDNNQETDCELTCLAGKYLAVTPKMSCGDGANLTTASGTPSYTACERTWCITNRSHNVIVCRIGDVLW